MVQLQYITMAFLEQDLNVPLELRDMTTCVTKYIQDRDNRIGHFILIYIGCIGYLSVSAPSWYPD